uniref:Uncharacterized protein n=1 Tax=uncultured marine virus TaxID=186617 RepID=A0A0F7L1N7_9VIRU|nr:hypothetical protein Clocel_3578 [uncultured marine virus]
MKKIKPMKKKRQRFVKVDFIFVKTRLMYSIITTCAKVNLQKLKQSVPLILKRMVTPNTPPQKLR